MLRSLRRNKKARRGSFTLEWILLATLLVVGIVGGLAALRDAMVSELFDAAACVQSMTFWCDQTNAPTEGPLVCPPGDPSCGVIP